MMEMLFPKTAPFLGIIFGLLVAPASAIDLRSSVVVAPANLAGPEKKAVAMLVDEVEKRTRIRLPVNATWSGSGTAILVGQQSAIAHAAILRGWSAALVCQCVDAHEGPSDRDLAPPRVADRPR